MADENIEKKLAQERIRLETEKKLGDIRARLLANPTPEELQQMTLHMDALKKWADISQMRMMASHDHDMASHHDHEP